MHTCVRQWGLSQNYQRLTGSVLEKSNDFIYLTGSSQGQVFTPLFSKNSYQTLDQKPDLQSQAPIKSSSSFPYSMSYIELHQSSDLPQGKRPKCLFVNIYFISQDGSEYQSLLQFLGDQPCTFIQSPYSQTLKFFFSQRPRWLYGLSHRSLIQAQFLAALGLESIASLKGDFIYIPSSISSQSTPPFFHFIRQRLLSHLMHNDESLVRTHSRKSQFNEEEKNKNQVKKRNNPLSPGHTSLFRELKRRHFVFFIDQRPHRHPVK